ILLEEGESVDALKNAGEQKARAATGPSPSQAAPGPLPLPEGRGEDVRTKKALSLQGEGAGEGRVFATPLAKRIAKDRGIDLSIVKGSGPHGRIVKADVEGAKGGGVAASVAALAPALSGD